MKLKVFDRILLAILLIAAIVVSFVLFGVSANVIKEGVAQDFVSLFYAYTQNRLILAGSGLVLLLVCLKLLFAGRGEKTPEQPRSALIRQGELGGCYITLAAVDGMVQKHCRAQERVKDCVTNVTAVEGGIHVAVRLTVLADTDVLTLTQELQKSLKSYVEGLTGIAVLDVGILVETAASPAATPARV